MKNSKYILYVFVICLFFAVSPVKAAVYNITDVPEASTVQNSVNGKTHPYLMGNEFNNLKNYLKTDAEFSQRFNRFYRDAKQKLKKVDTTVISTLADYADYGEDEIVEFAFIYRMTGDEEFAKGALNLILQTIAVSDWHESNTIETASVSMVCAIGYDWIYEYLTDTQKADIPLAVWNKSLSLAHNLYSGISGGYGNMLWWAVGCEHNWSLVCNAGFGAAALGFMNDLDSEKSAKCAEIVAMGLNSVQKALGQLGENGGWGEGVGYNQYGFLHYYKYISMLVEATGDDYGLLDYAPLKNNIMFPMYLTGHNSTFNFHDGGSGYPETIQLMFAAKYYDDASYAALREKALRIGAVDMSVFDLLWYVPHGSSSNINPDGFFDDAVVMRKSFDDENGIFAGLHGGKHNILGQFINHGFMDGGTFVLDALGERWAESLGGDSYSLNGYHDRTDGGLRWNYYRCRAEGSNTLVINPSENSAMDQVWGKSSTLTAQNLNGENPSATADMTVLYADAKSAVRTLQLTDNRKNAELTDVIELNKASEIYWFMHTKAEISIASDGKSALLTKNGKQMKVVLSSPSNAVFTEMSATPLSTSPQPTIQNPNTAYTKLAIHLTNTTNTTIKVKFEPQYEKDVLEISDDRSEVISDDFEDSSIYPSYPASGAVDLGYFKTNVNTLSDYKEVEMVQHGYDNRALLLRWIIDSDAGLTSKYGGGVKLQSDSGSFNPSGITVFDFSIKVNQVSEFKLEARHSGNKYCSLFTARGNQFGLGGGSDFVALADATGDYQRIRVVLDTNRRVQMLIVDNEIVYSEEYPRTWDFSNGGLLRFNLTGGTACNVNNINYGYACRVYIGDMYLYTTDGYSFDNVFAHKSGNSLRVACFGGELYNNSGFDANVFGAQYESNSLFGAAKRVLKLKAHEEEYIAFDDLKKNTVYYVWNDAMQPYFGKIQ